MNEITLDGKIYVSSKRAAEITGYAKDYVGQLCREGRVEARLVGRNWYVLKDAINDRKFEPVSPQIEEDTADSEPVSSLPEAPPVTYVSEIYEQIPSINRLAETRREETAEELVVEDPEPSSGVIDKLNDAWNTWFTKEEEKESQVLIHRAAEPQIEAEIGSEKVTLRRIREYRPAIVATMDIKAPILHEKSDAEPKTSVRKQMRGSQLVLINAVLVVIAAFALLIGYAGSRFYTPLQTLPQPINSIAGVNFYSKGQ